MGGMANISSAGFKGSADHPYKWNDHKSGYPNQQPIHKGIREPEGKSPGEHVNLLVAAVQITELKERQGKKNNEI